MEIFNVQLKCLQFLGFFRDVPSLWMKNLLKYYRVVAILIYLYFFSMGLVYTYQNISDVVANIDCFAVICANLTTTFKYFHFWYSADAFFALMMKIEEISDECEFSEKSIESLKINFSTDKTPSNLTVFGKALKKARMFYRVYLTEILLAVISYSLMPLLENVGKIIAGDTDRVPNFPIKAVSFFDVSSFPAYEINYLFIMVYIFIDVFVTVRMKLA
jgi:hypothetical protein